MFTGIIEAVGRVVAAAPNAFGRRLTIDVDGWDYQPDPGASIAVQGVCLTYAPQQTGHGPLVFDVVRETLDRSTLGGLSVGDRVNLEAALLPTTRMGGHFVQGHVDAVAAVHGVDAGAEQWRLTVHAPAQLLKYIVPKGSITIDGVSLTVASIDPAAATFDVALIPTTLKHTTLGALQVGHRINLETDVLVRSVAHVLEQIADARHAARLTLDQLRDSGFV